MANESKETVLVTRDGIDALLAAGRALGGVVLEHQGTPLMLVPEKYKIESLKQFLPPSNIEATPVCTDAASFCKYVNLFKGVSTLIFAALTDTGCSLVCVLDYHDPGGARWARHQVRLTLAKTTEWALWLNNDRKLMAQRDFALFLEEHAQIFAAPSGAELLELVLALEGKANARFSSALRLQSGQVKFNYEEDIELRGNVTGVQGALEMPSTLQVRLAPFEGMEPVDVTARLRYQIANKALAFKYETVAPHRIVRSAAEQVLEQVRERTGVPLLLGAP